MSKFIEDFFCRRLFLVILMAILFFIVFWETSMAVYFILAFILVVFLTLVVGGLANLADVVDRPRGRHQHKQTVPLLGGVAVFLAFALVVMLLMEPTQALPIENLLTILGVGTIYVLLGFLDDVYDISPWSKLLGQLAAAIVLVGADIKIEFIGNPFESQGLVEFGSYSALVTVLWIMLMVNATNWADGLDGLVTGNGLIAAVVIGILSLQTQNTEVAKLAFVLAGSLAGFLLYNFHPAKIFLGDSGSMFIGFILSVLAFLGGAKLATAILVLAIPILDTGLTIMYRLVKNKPVYVGDRNHLHHRLLDQGFSQRQVAGMFYAGGLAFGLVSLFLQGEMKLIAFLVLMVLFVLAWVFLWRISNLKR